VSLKLLPILLFTLTISTSLVAKDSTQYKEILTFWLHCDNIDANNIKKKELKKCLKLTTETFNYLLESTPNKNYKKLTQKLKELSKRVERNPKKNAEKMRLYQEIRFFRRKILFLHPDLQFKYLLINLRPPTTYSHQCDQYLGRHSRAGAGLTILKN